jgi:ABC-type multidrug transport system permease subunit
MARAVWLVFLNEFRLLASDRVGMFMLVLAPVVIILVAGLSLGNIYGAGPGPGAYLVPVLDEDHGVAARAIVSALEREPALTVLKVDNLASARAAVVRRDRTPLVLIIPSGTTRALATGGEARLMLYVDPVKRLEVSAVELRLGELTRQVTAQAEAQARRKLMHQGTEIKQEFEQLAQQIKQAQAGAKSYRRKLKEQRETAEASLNAQVQRALSELEKQTRAAVERSTAVERSRLEGEMAPRRDALLAVSRYLNALQASEHEFDRWFARLKAIAGAHSSQIPPPPALPHPPSQEQLAELSKPIRPPNIAPPQIPAIPRLTLTLPKLPQPPQVELPDGLGPSLSFTDSAFPGYLAWSERPIFVGNSQPNAFDQYVPGFGITFLLIAMLMAVAMGLIDERDWGTLQRLRVSGAPLLGVLTGKLCSRFSVGLLQMTVLLIVGWGLFGVSLGRTPAMLLVPTAAMSFAAAAFSLLIACIARTHDSVMPIGTVAAMAMSAIGGCWWPLDFEPGWMRTLARLLPTTWTMQAYNDLMIRHTTASGALWPSAFAAALGCLYLILGMIAASKLYQ